MIAFNRDEDLDREAEPLSFQKDFPNIICGLDKQTGTTWLALNKISGDFAVLTNFRTIKNHKPAKYQTRGILILEYVKIRDETIKDKMFQSIEQYEKEVFNHIYRGFNLIYGNILTGDLKYRKNDMDSVSEPMEVPKDLLHGMSNGGLNIWDKVHRGKFLM